MRARPGYRETLVPPSEIGFNYLGQVDQSIPRALPVRLARESAGPQRSGTSQRPYLLDVSAAIGQGTLEVSFTYSRNLHRPETIRSLAGDFVGELREILKHCTSPDAGGYTPYDFSLSGLDQKKLDRVVRKASRHGKPV